jgi:hypothetical protein
VLIRRGAEALVAPFRELRHLRTFRVRVGAERLEVAWQPGQRSPFPAAEGGTGRAVGSVSVRSARTGASIAASTPFWFAVAAFHSAIRIWTRADQAGQ